MVETQVVCGNSPLLFNLWLKIYSAVRGEGEEKTSETFKEKSSTDVSRLIGFSLFCKYFRVNKYLLKSLKSRDYATHKRYWPYRLPSHLTPDTFSTSHSPFPNQSLKGNWTKKGGRESFGVWYSSSVSSFPNSYDSLIPSSLVSRFYVLLLFGFTVKKSHSKKRHQVLL